MLKSELNCLNQKLYDSYRGFLVRTALLLDIVEISGA